MQHFAKLLGTRFITVRRYADGVYVVRLSIRLFVTSRHSTEM